MIIKPEEVIRTILLFDDHKSSDKVPSISTTELIGPYYKAWKSLSNAPKTNKLGAMKKRSSTIGTGYHMRAEQVLSNFDNVSLEVFTEKEIDGVTVSGTFDVAIELDDVYYLGDHKTGYGTKYDKTEQTVKQLSIYRWLNDYLNIADEAYIYWVSQSNNALATIDIELMSIEDTEQYIKDTLEIIKTEPDFVDCNSNPKQRYNACDWCEFECEYRKEKK